MSTQIRSYASHLLDPPWVCLTHSPHYVSDLLFHSSLCSRDLLSSSLNHQRLPTSGPLHCLFLPAGAHVVSPQSEVLTHILPLSEAFTNHLILNHSVYSNFTSSFSASLSPKHLSLIPLIYSSGLLSPHYGLNCVSPQNS